MNKEDRELQYHIRLKKGDVGRYCILPGDPARSELIAKFFDNPVHVGQNREFNSYTGTLLGEKVTVCSTGIGGPSATIAMEELTAIGADTFLRVGTCGGIDLRVKSDDIVIASGAVRFDGTSREYAPIEYPAVPHYEILAAMVDAARNFGHPWHVGVIHCKDSFYGQHSPERMSISQELEYKWNVWKRMGVLASEMESAALFVCADSLDVRCGSCFHVVWNQEREKLRLDQEESEDVLLSVKVCIEALKILIQRDRENAKRKKENPVKENI